MLPVFLCTLWLSLPIYLLKSEQKDFYQIQFQQWRHCTIQNAFPTDQDPKWLTKSDSKILCVSWPLLSCNPDLTTEGKVIAFGFKLMMLSDANQYKGIPA